MRWFHSKLSYGWARAMCVCVCALAQPIYNDGEIIAHTNWRIYCPYSLNELNQIKQARRTRGKTNRRNKTAEPNTMTVVGRLELGCTWRGMQLYSFCFNLLNPIGSACVRFNFWYANGKFYFRSADRIQRVPLLEERWHECVCLLSRISFGYNSTKIHTAMVWCCCRARAHSLTTLSLSNTHTHTHPFTGDICWAHIILSAPSNRKLVWVTILPC